jgi:hypothetical protein
MVSPVREFDFEQWFPAARAWSRKPLRQLRHIAV